ncbi:hypothetical protein [Dactylosporangium sp. CA-139066]|uniref:hypothetical protein n=1 Tax=Dactylosporangium sp. CA-139066 TaxID=3239930 RepID=UPI003D9425CA
MGRPGVRPDGGGAGRRARRAGRPAHGERFLLADEAGLGPFRLLLRHASPACARAAAYVLVVHRDHDAAAFADDFVPLLADPDHALRERAVQALTAAGPAALPGARRMRRTVPAGRRAALQVIAAVDWTALEPADVEAVRRLVRIKAPREVPAPVERESEPWFAVPSRAAAADHAAGGG